MKMHMRTTATLQHPRFLPVAIAFSPMSDTPSSDGTSRGSSTANCISGKTATSGNMSLEPKRPEQGMAVATHHAADMISGPAPRPKQAPTKTRMFWVSRLFPDVVCADWFNAKLTWRPPPKPCTNLTAKSRFTTVPTGNFTRLCSIAAKPNAPKTKPDMICNHAPSNMIGRENRHNLGFMWTPMQSTAVPQDVPILCMPMRVPEVTAPAPRLCMKSKAWTNTMVKSMFSWKLLNTPKQRTNSNGSLASRPTTKIDLKTANNATAPKRQNTAGGMRRLAIGQYWSVVATIALSLMGFFALPS
mmetsp:Transcript_123633/g.246087  ORF Transcript_123633/g.246087 Transcript_123633/m.246087 type:complete len:301 (-) Transcript_123633:296-1198(-)